MTRCGLSTVLTSRTASTSLLASLRQWESDAGARALLNQLPVYCTSKLTRARADHRQQSLQEDSCRAVGKDSFHRPVSLKVEKDYPPMVEEGCVHGHIRVMYRHLCRLQRDVKHSAALSRISPNLLRGANNLPQGVGEGHGQSPRTIGNRQGYTWREQKSAHRLPLISLVLPTAIESHVDELWDGHALK